MSGTAQVCEIRVSESLLDTTRAQVLRFTPPLPGDDLAEHEFGIACVTGGIVDVFAMDTAQPGRVLCDGDGLWVELLSCVSIDGPWTLERFMASCGIEVIR